MQQDTATIIMSRALASFNGKGVEHRLKISGNRIGLHLQVICQSLQRPQSQAHKHQALYAKYQRQSRAVDSDRLQRMNLLHAVPEFPGAKGLATLIPVDP